jgi:hypothetical protein
MLWVLSGYVPVAIVFACFSIWRVILGKQKIRPVKEKLLRSPGEFLRLKIERLDENIHIALFCLVATGAFLGMATAQLLNKPSAITGNLLAVVWSIGLAAQVGSAWWLVYLLKERRNWSVGEELNKLMRDGCLVFHDLPVENWNIDHVVIARTGVFAVETKARRKQRGKKADFHKVRFDGNALYFPGSKDKGETDDLEQTAQNAGWLCDFLSKALCEPIQVKAILTFPGWWVDREGKGAVTVLNHKEFRACILKGPDHLTSKQMDQIAFQIEQKCRDVSF